MKRFFIYFLVIIFMVTIVILVLNINATTQKGINYQWRSIKLPLYLKILDFFDRHYNYRQLVKSIIADAKTDEERVMKIFEWTYKNLKKSPDGFPVVDDHVWYIIVRGYGESDQLCDVFTTLCNYADIEAFYLLVSTADRKKRIPLGFVKLSRKWYIFDPYRGVYFKKPEGGLADIDFIKSNNSWIIETKGSESNIDYSIYFQSLPMIKKNVLNRANIQSPFNRIIFGFKKWIKWI